MMEQLSPNRPEVHRPAKASGEPSGDVMKYGCLPSGVRTHSYHPSAGTRQRRRAKDAAYAREVITVSERALIIRAPARGSSAHTGSRPKRATLSTRAACDSETRTMGAGSVGARL